MAGSYKLKPESSEATRYQIRLQGYLDPKWTDWFGGLTVAHEENGDTLLTGLVIDQAALYGLLKKVRDLGLPLLSVNPVNNRHSEAHNVEQKSINK